MKWLAGWLRKWADRIDEDGAPRRTSWSFTHEDGWGTVFNQDNRGCPVYYYGMQDYQLSHTDHAVPAQPDAIEWVTVGSRTPGGVHVLGSAEVIKAVTTRRIHGYDEGKMPGVRRLARIPRWRITLQCEMDSFVSLPGDSYPEAVAAMFSRPGIRG